jgi:hypothetical protein
MNIIKSPKKANKQVDDEPIQFTTENLKQYIPEYEEYLIVDINEFDQKAFDYFHDELQETEKIK